MLGTRIDSYRAVRFDGRWSCVFARRIVGRENLFEEFKNGFIPVVNFNTCLSAAFNPRKIGSQLKGFIITSPQIAAQSAAVFYIDHQYSKIGPVHCDTA